MSRVSDTRLRTRQAAAKLVAAGRRPHQLTVDLIYAEIGQGSRTTINDELKLWKDEQAKVDALSAALPAPVANAMLAAWAVAVEHGEHVFDERRVEVEGELALSAARAEAAEAARAAAQAEIASLREQLDQVRAAEASARVAAQRERDDKDAALRKIGDLEHSLAAERTDASSRLTGQRDSYEQQLREQRDAVAASEARLREELARATERLEGVQKHVMLQVTEAREAQRRSEDQLAKALQRAERQAGELEALRTEAVALTTRMNRAAQDQAAAVDNAARLRFEKDELAVRLATTSGRLEAASQQAADLLARIGAPASETRASGAGRKRVRTAT
jgi:chromosome segregation ATPase